METISITVPKEKADSLKQLATSLTPESLKILAEKSKKPGMDQKLKTYQHFI